MRAVLQRVKYAKVQVDQKTIGQIEKGLLVYLGVGHKDKPEDIEWIVDKVVHQRVFADDEGKMNLSVNDVEGQILLISQFTLYGDCRKGRRPSFTKTAKPEVGEEIFNQAIEAFKATGIKIETGEFGADMQVESINDGPVTFLLDSKKLF